MREVFFDALPVTIVILTLVAASSCSLLSDGGFEEVRVLLPRCLLALLLASTGLCGALCFDNFTSGSSHLSGSFVKCGVGRRFTGGGRIESQGTELLFERGDDIVVLVQVDIGTHFGVFFDILQEFVIVCIISLLLVALLLGGLLLGCLVIILPESFFIEVL